MESLAGNTDLDLSTKGNTVNLRREVVSLPTCRLLGEGRSARKIPSNTDCHIGDVMFWGRCFLRTLPEHTGAGSG